MIVPRNAARQDAPLAWRLKIDELHAHLASLERYGPTGVGSAIAVGVRALISGWRRALRVIVRGPACEAA